MSNFASILIEHPVYRVSSHKIFDTWNTSSRFQIMRKNTEFFIFSQGLNLKALKYK